MKQKIRATSAHLHERLARIVTVALGLEDAWRLASLIVEETARRYTADISTLFQVQGDRMVLQGGVLLVKQERVPIPILAQHLYKLPWEAKNWAQLEHKGITPGVAVFNEALEINSYAELIRNPAHLGQWDRYIYPNGPDDPDTGFGCLFAVPLRLRDRGQARDVVVGVFKIERRRNRPVFHEAERAAFAIVAQHLNHILRTSEQVTELVNDNVDVVLRSVPRVSSKEMERRVGILSRYDRELQAVGTNADEPALMLRGLGEELPEAVDWMNAVMKNILRAFDYQPGNVGRRFFTVLRTLRVDPLQEPKGLTVSPLIKKVEIGFSKLSVPPESADAALRNLERWLDGPVFRGYRPQLTWLIETEQWNVLLDSFYRILPFGTGGRRGPVGIGTNRFNPITLESSVQGHVDYLRERYPDQELAVVIAYDVRAFNDLRRIYNPTLENPLRDMTSQTFAHLAVGVYAASGVRVYMLPTDSDTYISTPELSYIIRRLKLNGGLNVSASHNHPDDNGGKFFGAQGGQEVPPNDQEMAERVESVGRIASLTLAGAREAGLLQFIPPELHDEYVNLNLAQSLDPDARSALVVFTPLHGTGQTTAGEVLRRAGFKVVSVLEQSNPDGSFPTVPFRAPNPEVPESMLAGIEVARRVRADLVLACDPDADRIGLCSVLRNGEYRFFNGNEIAAVVTHYKLDSLRTQNRLPARPLIIKTEVTSELLCAITNDFKGILIGNLLVGFKYLGNVLAQLEETGRYKDVEATLNDFVIAVEESHGILVTPDLRDKDAAGAAILLAELASQLRTRGRTLADYLDDIYLRYGYHSNQITSMVMSGAEGVNDIQKIQAALRQHPPSSIAGLKVIQTIDHLDPKGTYGELLSDTDRAARNVLVFRLENGARVIIRPSGTEPKNKIYVEVPSAPLGIGADEEALVNTKADLNSVAQQIVDDFTGQMLTIIGVELPQYAIRISGLVALDKRIAFAREFMPSFEVRVDALRKRQTSAEEVSKWIDEDLSSYGEDARGLVGDAVRAYLEIERTKAAHLDHRISNERLLCLGIMATFFPTQRADNKKT